HVTGVQTCALPIFTGAANKVAHLDFGRLVFIAVAVLDDIQGFFSLVLRDLHGNAPDVQSQHINLHPADNLIGSLNRPPVLPQTHNLITSPKSHDCTPRATHYTPKLL